MIKVIIADDHPVVRKGIKQILEENKKICVKNEAGNGFELIDKLKKERIDVVLLDISMPGRNGLDILKQIRNEMPNLSVLILSMHPEEQYAIRALKAGASGYLTKDSAPEELINAIYKVSQGGKYVTNTLAEKLAHELEIDFVKPLHENLSDREYEVMCMIASGKTVSEIAKNLNLSVKTISTYRVRILNKLQFNNNAELTRFVLEYKLI